jgi:ribosomal protein S18 acetylase RimI-like enzyme
MLVRSAELRSPLWIRQLLARLKGAPLPSGSRGRRVALRDGAEVLIRPIRSTDAAHLADGFARLSPQSRRARFLTGKDHLSAAELRYLTDVDHHDHEALCAMSTADGRGVAVARYIRQADDRHAAEFALTVVDEWQHRGLGTALLTILASRARRAGIHRATAFVAADNTAAVGLLRRLGGDHIHLVHGEPDMAEYEISLMPVLGGGSPAGAFADGQRSPASEADGPARPAPSISLRMQPRQQDATPR